MEPMLSGSEQSEKGMRRSRTRGVAGLLLGIFICLGVIYIFIPAVCRMESVQPLITFIEERDIDAGALYYTEIEEFSIANINMENSMDFPPKGPE